MAEPSIVSAVILIVVGVIATYVLAYWIGFRRGVSWSWIPFPPARPDFRAEAVEADRIIETAEVAYLPPLDGDALAVPIGDAVVSPAKAQLREAMFAAGDQYDVVVRQRDGLLALLEDVEEWLEVEAPADRRRTSWRNLIGILDRKRSLRRLRLRRGYTKALVEQSAAAEGPVMLEVTRG